LFVEGHVPDRGFIIHIGRDQHRSLHALVLI
jgi:hypothetical protein